MRGETLGVMVAGVAAALPAPCPAMTAPARAALADTEFKPDMRSCGLGKRRTVLHLCDCLEQ